MANDYWGGFQQLRLLNRVSNSGEVIVLILTRRVGETIKIGADVDITVLSVKGQQIRFGIKAPRHVAVHREEVFERIKQESTLPTLNESSIDSVSTNG
jgi:carbon storage regulator